MALFHKKTRDMMENGISKRANDVFIKHAEDSFSMDNIKSFLFDMLEPSEDRMDMIYRYEHSLRVWENGKIISCKEGFSKEECVDLEIACLLHDVGYRECKTLEELKKHPQISADFARRYLENIGYPSERIHRIVLGVKYHSLTADLPKDMTTFMISVRDSDDIDRFDMMRTSMTLFDCVHDKSNAQIIESCNREIDKVNYIRSLPRGTKTAREMMDECLNHREELIKELISQAKKGVSEEE